MIITFIIIALSFTSGLWIGSKFPATIEQTGKIVKKITKRKQRLGGINRPPEEELEKRGTRLEEEEKEMERVLKDKI